MPQAMGIEVARVFRTRADLREVANPPSRFVANKAINHVDALARRFIARAPLVFLASQKADGTLDVTPRGDPEGFVHVLDDRTIALPDRPGNMRMDTFENVLETGHVGLIFVVPGHNETLRVSGRAQLVEAPDLAARMAVNGKPCGLVLLIRVTHVLSHCPKAFIRARAWAPEHWPDASGLPSAGEMLVAHGALPDPVAAVDEIVRRDGETRLY